ncbi:recombinase family protein [Laceyella putida]|uniref:Recombinase family protein n=1 Tax=Laceyella putida TaxID=110101 RepID=A0ABW2RK87_9BACL
MERVAIYLRKSRADLEAEARGEGETLAKHKKALLKLAKKMNLNIVRIRQEVVSGESLIHRPEMMELLKEVDAGFYDGVLVMDMDRLGRGNMQEQGIILDTFKKSGTKIITPRKTYDLRDEFDEEYTEFEAFMARKELKIITRRLQSGRVRSVEEGNYIGTRPPYGYQIVDDRSGRYLVPDPEQAPVVKMIFDWYTNDNPNERLGCGHIANRLNELGLRTYTNKLWNSSSVLTIIKNAVYIGRIQWKKKSYKKSLDPTKTRESKTRPQSEWIDVKGKHEPLISEEQFQKAQEILKKKYHVPYHLMNGITNPLAGLIRCVKCNSSMVLRPYTKQKPHLICKNRHCDNKSTRFDLVENRVITGLNTWLEAYQLQWSQEDMPKESNHKVDLIEVTIKNLQTEIKNLEAQKGRLHDLLERQIYDEETYLERSKNLAVRLNEVREAIERSFMELEKEKSKAKAQIEIIPRVKHVLELYPQLDDPKQKNTLLKSVLEFCIYRKEKHQRGEEFELTLHPKI